MPLPTSGGDQQTAPTAPRSFGLRVSFKRGPYPRDFSGRRTGQGPAWLANPHVYPQQHGQPKHSQQDPYATVCLLLLKSNMATPLHHWPCDPGLCHRLPGIWGRNGANHSRWSCQGFESASFFLSFLCCFLSFLCWCLSSYFPGIIPI